MTSCEDHQPLYNGPCKTCGHPVPQARTLEDQARAWRIAYDAVRAKGYQGLGDALEALSAQQAAGEAVAKRPVVPAKNGFLSFWYRNYRGELSERVALPIRIYHGATEWHPEPQWLLEAWDMEKDAVRAFAMGDMQAPPQPTETQRIVAWLLEVADEPAQEGDAGQALARRIAARFFANAIARGEHLAGDKA